MIYHQQQLDSDEYYYNVLYDRLPNNLRLELESIWGSVVLSKRSTYNIDPLLLNQIREALRMHKSICSCQRNHCYVIAGGFPAYFIGNTSSYTDIDIYVNCNGSLKDLMPCSSLNSYTVRRNVADIMLNGTKLQIIQVDFNVYVKDWECESAQGYVDLFAMYVVGKFDLPICRVALSFLQNETYILNGSGFYGFRSNLIQERVLKYKAREVSGWKGRCQITQPQVDVVRLFQKYNCTSMKLQSHSIYLKDYVVLLYGITSLALTFVLVSYILCEYFILQC